MAHRSTLSVVVFALSLTAAGAAQAQHRPRRHHEPAAANARTVRSPQNARESISLGEGEADAEGRYHAVRSATFSRGDAVTFSATSGDVDVLVRATGPNGQTWEDDDSGGGTDARLRFVAPVSGTYELTVTTYRAGEVGDVDATLSVNDRTRRDDAQNDDAQDDDAQDDSAQDDDTQDELPAVPSAAAQGAGTTYGVFVGITHYRGENEDLPNTADDARNLAGAFQRAGWMQRQNAIVLTDENATADRVRQAFATLAPRVGPNDLFVFFFDGHGNADEIDLRGRDLDRRGLSRLLDNVHGRSLVVLDSCNAGGFASVIQGHADRAGLFSSRANEESSVASEVNSGGWLAWHFRRAVEGGVRRGDDGSIRFEDVTRYVQTQYRQSRVRDQHLVAVRGDTRGTFAIGGTGDAIANGDPDVMVARNDRQRPLPSPVQPEAWGGASDGNDGPNTAGTAPLGDAFGQAMNLGVGLANGVFETLTK